MSPDHQTLIITNGDSTVELLDAAGSPAAHLAWRDVLHIGPVPLTSSHETLSMARAHWLAENGFADPEEAEASFAERDGLLARADAFEQIELWFEHDLYDQLQLIQALDYFSARGDLVIRLSLVQGDTYLSDFTPKTILSLRERAQPLTGETLETASQAWAAFRSETPEALAALASSGILALPHLSHALNRMLEELPDATTGLSRTEHAVLAALKERGVATPVDLFRAVSAQEDARFMGDSVLWHLLDGLAFAGQPLLRGLPGRFYETAMKSYLVAPLELTEAGNNVLSGRADHATLNEIDLWLGGTHVTNDNLWRWDTETGTLISPR